MLALKGTIPLRPDISIDDELWNILNLCWAREPAKWPTIASIQDRLQALTWPTFDKEISLRPQGNGPNQREGLDVEGTAFGEHAGAVGIDGELTAGEDANGDEDHALCESFFLNAGNNLTITCIL